MEYVKIPRAFTSPIKTLIEWHLETYLPYREIDIRLERILEHFFHQNMIDGFVQVEKGDLYYINECVSDATNNFVECGVSQGVVWNIYDWVVNERKK